MKWYYNLLFVSTLLISVSGCGQNKKQFHKHYSKVQMDSARQTDSIMNIVVEIKKRQANPQTDSLRVTAITTVQFKGSGPTYLIADIQNETPTYTWKFKQIVFHIFLNGKETQSIPGYPSLVSDGREVDKSLYNEIPPNLTVEYASQNPVKDPQTNNNLTMDYLKQYGRFTVEIIYNVPIQTNSTLTTTQSTRTDTLILTSGEISMGAGSFFHFSSQKDKDILGNTMDSCIVKQHYEYMWTGAHPGDKCPSCTINPKFLNKKYAVTYRPTTIPLPPDGDSTVSGMNISKMVLVK